jgi:hypothetical protein
MKLIEFMRSEKLVNALLLKAAWIACVMGGNLYGAAVVLMIFLMSIYQGSFSREWHYAAALGLFGLFLDSAWMYFEVLDYSNAGVISVADFVLAPPWIVLLWVAVGFSLNHGLVFFVERPLVGAAIVGASAPFSYLAGERFDAVIIPAHEKLLILGLVWFLVFYAVFSWTKYTNTRGAKPSKSLLAA